MLQILRALMIDVDTEISEKRFGSSNYGDKIANITILNGLDKSRNGISKERGKGKENFIRIATLFFIKKPQQMPWDG